MMKPADKSELCSDHLIGQFFDGTLNAEVESQFVEHLDGCDICRERLEHWDNLNNVRVEARDLIGVDRWYEQASLHQLHNTLPFTSQIELVVQALNPTDDPDMLGRIGSYEVQGVIGSGGMGVVLKAHDRSLDRTLAVKVLAPVLASSGLARSRFLREAKAVAAVLHPNVIAIHSVSIDHELPFLVMPYIRGTTLQKRLDAQGPLSLKEILRIGSQIAAGLAATHEHGIVHRDIKPSNILIEEGVERVTITDFGLARTLEDVSLTQSNVIAGTPIYMSPEQVRGETIDARSDLFSLGSVLYTLCTGHPPFRSDNAYGVMRRITDDAPRSVRESNPDIPAWFEFLVMSLMAKDKSKRLGDAKRVEAMLRQCLAHTEQPHVVSLPDELVNNKGTKKAVRKWIMASTTVGVLGGLLSVLLSGHVLDKGDSKDKNLGQVKVGTTEVELIGIGDTANMEMVTEFDVSRMKINQQFQQFGQNGANASVNGGAGGGGGGFGVSYNKPNFGLAFNLKSNDKQNKDKQSKIVELGSKFSVTDEKGKVSDSPDMGPVKHRFPDFEREYGSTECLYMYLPSSTVVGKVKGELLVTPGRKLVAKFDELKPKKMQVDGEELAIESANWTNNGLQISVRYPETTASKKAKTPQEKLQAVMLERAAHQLTIEDASGHIYVPAGASNVGGNAQTSFSFSNFNGVQSVQGNAGSSPTPVVNFTLPSIKEDTKIKSITVTFVDKTGEAKSVPFEITVQ